MLGCKSTQTSFPVCPSTCPAQALNTHFLVLLFIHKVDTQWLTWTLQWGFNTWSKQVNPTENSAGKTKVVSQPFSFIQGESHSPLWVILIELHAFAEMQVSYFCNGPHRLYFFLFEAESGLGLFENLHPAQELLFTCHYSDSKLHSSLSIPSACTATIADTWLKSRKSDSDMMGSTILLFQAPDTGVTMERSTIVPKCLKVQGHLFSVGKERCQQQLHEGVLGAEDRSPCTFSLTVPLQIMKRRCYVIIIVLEMVWSTIKNDLAKESMKGRGKWSRKGIGGSKVSCEHGLERLWHIISIASSVEWWWGQNFLKECFQEWLRVS